MIRGDRKGAIDLYFNEMKSIIEKHDDAFDRLMKCSGESCGYTHETLNGINDILSAIDEIERQIPKPLNDDELGYFMKKNNELIRNL